MSLAKISTKLAALQQKSEKLTAEIKDLSKIVVEETKAEAKAKIVKKPVAKKAPAKKAAPKKAAAKKPAAKKAPAKKVAPLISKPVTAQ